MPRWVHSKVGSLLLGCWLVAGLATPVLADSSEESGMAKALAEENVSSLIFDVYPSESVISRKAAGTKQGVSDIGAPGKPIDLVRAFKDRTDEGVRYLYVRSRGDFSAESDPRIWQPVKVTGISPEGDEKRISVYLHPKNKLLYLTDFPFYLPKTFALTCLVAFGGLLFGIRRAFDVKEARRRASVLAEAKMEYEREFGQWLVIGKIGSGGMGEVLRAFPKDDIRKEKMVAIKLRTGLDVKDPTPELLERDAEDLRRFRTETKVLVNLDHHGIVKIYDWGTHEGRDYYVMDIVDGESLQSYLDRTPKPPLDEVRSLFVQLLEAMNFAHEKGVLHRDLKPLNVLRDKQGHLTVIDFGLARDQNQTVAFTQMGMPFVGSLEYMDPRVSLQMFAKITPTPSDQGTDQFALGSILFLLLTGQPAIELPAELGPQGIVPVLMQISEPRRSSREFRPELPDELHKVVETMLEVEVEKRYPDLKSARDAFVRAIDPLL